MTTTNDDAEVHFDKIVAVKVAQEGKEEKMVDLRILIQSIHDKSSTSASGNLSSVWRSAEGDRIQDSSRLFASREQSNSLQKAPRTATYQNTVKKLMIRFTDEENAFFLLCGLIGEEDFQKIKKENSIQCEFKYFPQMLIQLIEKSVIPVGQQREVEGKCYTNFLELRDSDATFAILQDDEFRQLTYLSLRMRAGNDAAIKGYLSAELKEYKLQCARLEQELCKTKDNLSRQLNEMQIRVEHLSKREMQLESEKTETLAQQKHYFYDQIQQLKDTHERRLQDECQKMTSEHRSEIERLQLRQTQLENTVNPLTSENKQLTESKLRAEAENASLSAQLSTLREESEAMKKEISRLVSSNAMLSSKNNENTTAITSDKVLISRLQQQTEDQGERIKDLQNAHESEKQSVSVLQDHLKELNDKLDRAKEREKHLIKEITKGNSIIQKHEMKFSKQIKRRYDMKMALLQTETVLKNALQQQRNAENENERLIEKMSASQEKAVKLQDTLQSKIDELNRTKQLLEREKETNRTLAEELRYQKSRDFKSSMYSGFSSSTSGVTRSGIGDFRTRQTSVGRAALPAANMVSEHSTAQRSPRGSANHDTATSVSSDTVQYSATANDHRTESTVQGSSSTSEGTGMAAFTFTKQFDDNGTYVGGVRTAISQQRRTQHNSGTWDRKSDSDNGKVFFDVNSAHNKRFH